MNQYGEARPFLQGLAEVQISSLSHIVLVPFTYPSHHITSLCVCLSLRVSLSLPRCAGNRVGPPGCSPLPPRPSLPSSPVHGSTCDSWVTSDSMELGIGRLLTLELGIGCVIMEFAQFTSNFKGVDNEGAFNIQDIQ